MFLPFLFIYAIIIWLRNYFYDKKWLKVIDFNKPIISVGNISTGGTGKTPLVIYIAKLLIKNNKIPAVISRGYGRKSKGLRVVHDGNKIINNSEVSGDEPFLIAQTINIIPVIVAENRVKGINYLIDKFEFDVIIMDDGFQHRAVKRNLDIITISAQDPIANYKLLPIGNLREPLKKIYRADCIIYTKTDNYKIPDIHYKIKDYIKLKYLLSISKPLLMKFENGNYKKTLLPEEPVVVFCGIADPGSLILSINKLSIKIKNKYFFNDHQFYNEKKINKLIKQIKINQTNSILTTQKDLVKLPKSFLLRFNVYVIIINTEFKIESEIQYLIESIF